LLKPIIYVMLVEQLLITSKLNIIMSKRHHVSFTAHKKVREEAHIAFTTKAGKPVSFDGHKKVKEPVRVGFMAKNKS
jgi:hypothetical protein